MGGKVSQPSCSCPVALTRHFDLLYIQQGVDRISKQNRLELIPTLLVGLADNYRDSNVHAASLFYVFLKLLYSLTLPPRGEKEDLALRGHLGFGENDEDAEFVASWIGKLILLSFPQSNGRFFAIPSIRRKLALKAPICKGTEMWLRYDFHCFKPIQTGSAN